MTETSSAAGNQQDELDLTGYPAERGRSLLQIAAGALALHLSPVMEGRSSGYSHGSLAGFVGVGIAIGILLGLFLISIDPSA